MVVNSLIGPISLTENDLPVQTMPSLSSAVEALMFRQKDPKPLTPRVALLEKVDTICVWAGQLAVLRQGPLIHVSIHP